MIVKGLGLKIQRQRWRAGRVHRRSLSEFALNSERAQVCSLEMKMVKYIILTSPERRKIMPGDLAMVEAKRQREAPSGEGASGWSAKKSKRGRVGAAGKLVIECTMCGQACSRPSHLTAHMRTHSGDRPYACSTCSQAFSTSSSLARHERTHIGDRPYACTTCGKAFSESSSLTRHCKNVHALNHG